MSLFTATFSLLAPSLALILVTECGSAKRITAGVAAYGRILRIPSEGANVEL